MRSLASSKNYYMKITSWKTTATDYMYVHPISCLVLFHYILDIRSVDYLIVNQVVVLGPKSSRYAKQLIKQLEEQVEFNSRVTFVAGKATDVNDLVRSMALLLGLFAWLIGTSSHGNRKSNRKSNRCRSSLYCQEQSRPRRYRFPNYN